MFATEIYIYGEGRYALLYKFKKETERAIGFQHFEID